jgi:hypothetical protein
MFTADFPRPRIYVRRDNSILTFMDRPRQAHHDNIFLGRIGFIFMHILGHEDDEDDFGPISTGEKHIIVIFNAYLISNYEIIGCESA